MKGVLKIQKKNSQKTHEHRHKAVDLLSHTQYCTQCSAIAIRINACNTCGRPAQCEGSRPVQYTHTHVHTMHRFIIGAHNAQSYGVHVRKSVYSGLAHKTTLRMISTYMYRV